MTLSNRFIFRKMVICFILVFMTFLVTLLTIPDTILLVDVSQPAPKKDLKGTLISNGLINNTELFKAFDTGLDDFDEAITVDSKGNIFVAGCSRDLNYTSGKWMYYIFLAKFNSSGDFQWIVPWSKTKSDIVTDIAADSQDNVYIVGSTGTRLLFLKYHPNGTCAWTRTYSQGYESMATALTLDIYDNY